MILSRVNSRNEYADAIEPIDNTAHATHNGSPQSYATNTQNSLPTHLLTAHFSAEEDAQGIYDEAGGGGGGYGGGGGGYGGDWPASISGGFTGGGISGGGLTYYDPSHVGGGGGSAPAYDAGSGSPSGPSMADGQSPPQIVGVITKEPSTNDSNVTTTSGRFPDPVTTAPNGDTAYWGESWTNDGTQVHDYTSVTVQAAPDPNQSADNSGSSFSSNALKGAGEMVLGGVGITAGAGITAIGAAVTAAGLATTEFGVGLIGDALGPVIAAGGLAATAWSANLFTKGVNDYMSPSDGLQGPQTTVITPTPPQPTTNSGPGPDGLQGLPTTVTIPTPPLPNINPGSTPDGLQGPQSNINQATVADVLAGSVPNPRTPVLRDGTLQQNKPGGMPAANADFDNLQPSNVQDLGEGLRIGTLADGTQLVVRPKSVPSLEINPPTGPSYVIRYIP